MVSNGLLLLLVLWSRYLFLGILCLVEGDFVGDFVGILNFRDRIFGIIVICS